MKWLVTEIEIISKLPILVRLKIQPELQGTLRYRTFVLPEELNIETIKDMASGDTEDKSLLITLITKHLKEDYTYKYIKLYTGTGLFEFLDAANVIKYNPNKTNMSR